MARIERRYPGARWSRVSQNLGDDNSEAREWRHASDKTQTNKLEWWMILKISLRAKAGFRKILRLHSLFFPQNKLMLTVSRWEFSDLHSTFRLRTLRYYSVTNSTGATQRFSANHNTSSEQKNRSSFISHRIQVRSNLTGNWCERRCERRLRRFYLRRNVVHFHHRKGT